MITLLLGLFIVLFAMSTINPHQYDNLRRSLSQTFHGDVLEETGGVLDGSTSTMDPSASAESTQAVVDSVNQASQASGKVVKKQTQQLKQLVKDAKLGNDVKVTTNERGIKLTLAGDALFDSGQSTLKPDVTEKLTKLERQLDKFHRKIEIVGHTDGQPFQGPTGNWGLSAERAAAVAWFFRGLGYDDSLMSAKGLADTVPTRPLKPGQEHANIPANRRIEITILAPGVDDPRGSARGVAEAMMPVRVAAAAHGRATPSPIDQQLEAELNAGIVDEIISVSGGQG
jgi:chemotaxis protein MotB